MGHITSYDGFYTSVYWTTALLSHAMLSLLIALSLITAEALDLVKSLQVGIAYRPAFGPAQPARFRGAGLGAARHVRAAMLPVALVVADLDRFKSLNDRHGHAAGDQVIAGFAAHLRVAAGTRAVAGRMGGEEFAVLLPMADPAAARLFAEAVRTVFSAEAIDGLPREVRVTASFGIAARSGDESLADLTRRADEALYHAKRGGRTAYGCPTNARRKASRPRRYTIRLRPCRGDLPTCNLLTSFLALHGLLPSGGHAFAGNNERRIHPRNQPVRRGAARSGVPDHRSL